MFERSTSSQTLSVCLTLLAVGCASGPVTLEADAVPRLFAPGVVSTPRNEFATTFSGDGRTVYFNRVDDEGRITIQGSTWTEGVWSPSEPLSFSDGRFRDVDPFVVQDGSRMFFTSDRSEGTEPSADFDIWVAPRDGEGWAEPERLPSPPNSPASEAFVSVTLDGTLYFGSTNTVDGVRRVFRSPRDGSGYLEPREVDLGLPQGVFAGNPLILPDESALVFTSPDLPGAGAVDLFVSFRDGDGRWSPPRPLPAPINSSHIDYAPGLGPRRELLFLSSNRPGVIPSTSEAGRPPGDIYFVRFPEPRSEDPRPSR